MAARAKRREEVEQAYALQAKAASWGALKYGTFGAALATFAHHTWPTFRHMLTLACCSSVSPQSCASASSRTQRAPSSRTSGSSASQESRLRREARIDLARRGVVGTETEITKWKEDHAARAQAEREQQQQQASLPSQSTPS
ncbi:hypothetical protein DFH11DRAFT_1727867 [Phellopilus nigrolimitatus]|nr:hypothetical protein DFH11DRAFT_1727867 [Phellopilus nigrolimitatus]